MQEFVIGMLVHRQRSVDRLHERQLCYSRVILLMVVTILPPDHVGYPGFPQIIIAAERCVEEYSWGTTFNPLASDHTPFKITQGHHFESTE